MQRGRTRGIDLCVLICARRPQIDDNCGSAFNADIFLKIEW